MSEGEKRKTGLAANAVKHVKLREKDYTSSRLPGSKLAWSCLSRWMIR